MIFGLHPILQKERIEELCFNTEACGKITLGAVDAGPEIGAVFVCREETCPYEDKRSPVLGMVYMPGHEMVDEPFCLRKLREKTDA